MAEPAHSKWSASGFEQRMLCPGSHVMQADKANTTSVYAAEGTAAHQVLTWALQESRPASAYIGRVIEVDGFTFTVDDDMAGHVQTCVDYVLDAAGDDGVIFADIRVNYSRYLGVPEEDAWGTADAIIARGDEIIVVDFKYGMGVEVSAGYDTFITTDGVELQIPVRKPNAQMALYALGALEAYNGLAGDFTKARLVISQPRIKKAHSEYDLTVKDLEFWAEHDARGAVERCQKAADSKLVDTDSWANVFLLPGEKQCKFCSAKATCPRLRDEVTDAVFGRSAASPDEFDAVVEGGHPALAGPKPIGADIDVKWIAACLSKVDLIEDWCKAVRAEAERRLLAGESVPGFKVVQGKRGARQWVDAKAAEETLKSMRLKVEEMYDFKLISPTTADKLAKAGTIGPRQWPRLQGLITQNEGKPHVAPESDPRPAIEIRPVVEEFTNLADDLA